MTLTGTVPLPSDVSVKLSATATSSGRNPLATTAFVDCGYEEVLKAMPDRDSCTAMIFAFGRDKLCSPRRVSHFFGQCRFSCGAPLLVKPVHSHGSPFPALRAYATAAN